MLCFCVWSACCLSVIQSLPSEGSPFQPGSARGRDFPAGPCRGVRSRAHSPESRAPHVQPKLPQRRGFQLLPSCLWLIHFSSGSRSWHSPCPRFPPAPLAFGGVFVGFYLLFLCVCSRGLSGLAVCQVAGTRSLQASLKWEAFSLIFC